MSRFEVVATDNISFVFKKRNCSSNDLMVAIGMLVSMLAAVHSERDDIPKERFIAMMNAYINTIWEKQRGKESWKQ